MGQLCPSSKAQGTLWREGQEEHGNQMKEGGEQYGMLAPGHVVALTLLNSQRLWLPAQDLLGGCQHPVMAGRETHHVSPLLRTYTQVSVDGERERRGTETERQGRDRGRETHTHRHTQNSCCGVEVGSSLKRNSGRGGQGKESADNLNLSCSGYFIVMLPLCACLTLLTSNGKGRKSI